MSLKKIRVMHCLTVICDGGQETFLPKTLRYIQNNSISNYDFMISSLSIASNKELIEKYKQEGIGYYPFNFSNRKRSIKDVVGNLIELFNLSRLIKRKEVDILYGHDFFSALIVRLSYLITYIFYFYKIKRVYVSLHNILFWLKSYHHFINKLLSIFTDKIVCVSNSVFEYSLNSDKIDKGKYLVIPNGIDVHEFSFKPETRKKVRSEFNLMPVNIIIGTVGTLSIRKGHKYLISAFKDIVIKYPSAILYIFGGTRDFDRESEIKNEISELINKFNLIDKVKICKPRLDICRIYSMFDIYIMPSVVEGFGLSLVEAMAMERIVIASDIPPFREIIEDKYDGFLFKSQDSEDLKNKIFHVINLNELVKKNISKRARDKVLNRYNSDLMGKAYENLYNI